MTEPAMLSDMEFEHKLAEMGDDQPALLRFVAREAWKAAKLVQDHENRLKVIETRDANALTIGGGVGGVIGAAGASFVYWLMNKFGV